MELIRSLSVSPSVEIAVVSRFLKHSSTTFLEELKKFGVRLIASIPIKDYETKRFISSVVKVMKEASEAEIILPRATRLDVKKLKGYEIFDEIIVVCGSTGALEAFYKLLKMIEINNEKAVVICLHTIKTSSLVRKIREHIGFPVEEVFGMEEFEPGKVYILRSGRNYKLVSRRGKLFLRSFRERLGLGYRPSINLIMENISAVFGERCRGVVLSGYGNDGVLGSKLILLRGGKILLQDPETAKIPSMPRLVKEAVDLLGKGCELIRLA